MNHKPIVTKITITEGTAIADSRKKCLLYLKDLYVKQLNEAVRVGG
jgi:hypothetical protein